MLTDTVKDFYSHARVGVTNNDGDALVYNAFLLPRPCGRDKDAINFFSRSDNFYSHARVGVTRFL